ncbi:MAG: oligosaccharide flippase family protein [Deltaproteobacteria bacterium]|nr:oligosaccharide flippase family protein [Candidatus Zymogenaceae bacterium]
MSTLEKLIKNISFNALNNGITLVTGFILSIVIARLLGPEDMGVYSYCSWLLGFASVFCFLGIPNTNTRYISELNTTGQTDRMNHLFRSLLLLELGVFVIVSGVVVGAAYLFYEPDIRIYIILVAANLLPNTVFALYVSTFKGLLRFNVIAVTSLIVTPVYIVAVIVGLYLGMGITGLLVLPLVLAPPRFLLFRFFLRKSFTPTNPAGSGALDQTLKKRIFSFWYKFLILSLIDVVVFEKSEVFFLNIYADYSQIAFYTIAFSLSSKVMRLIPYSLTNIMLPIFTEKHSTGDTDGQNTIYTYSLKYLMMIIAPIFVGGVFVSTEIITNLYGIEFAPAADIFWITLLSASLAAFFGSSASLLGAMEKLSFLLAIGVVSICLNISMDLVLIPRYGIHGAAWANLIAQVFSGVVLFIFIILTIKPKIPWKDLFRIIIASVVCGLIADAVLMINGNLVFTVLAIAAAAAAYPLVLIFVGALGKNDLEIFSAVETVLPGGLRSTYRMVMGIFAKLVERSPF